MTTMRRFQHQGVLIDRIWYLHPLLARFVGSRVEIRATGSDGRADIYTPASFICTALAAETLAAETTLDAWMLARIRRRRESGSDEGTS